MVHPTTVAGGAVPLQRSANPQLASAPWWTLFAVSCAALYTEIMLIRWISTEVRVFAYFQNLALIACFLGFGLGCYWSERRTSLLSALGAMTALAVLVTAALSPWQALLANISNLLSLSPDAALWGLSELRRPSGESSGLYLIAGCVLTLLLLLIIMSMVPFGQCVGSIIDSARNPIRAYSVNLVGSLIGTWVLALAAFLYLPPVYWFGVAFILVAVTGQLSRREQMIAALLLVVSVLSLTYHTADRLTYWSPYQKLQLQVAPEHEFGIEVNNTAYMTIANVTPEFRAHHPELAAQVSQSSYDSPFRFAARLDRVLIVGAGAGNDAAAALRNGARQVDAVEIDPLIYSLGDRLHPEMPYRSSQVRVILNDARSFLRQTGEKYDLIVFGLLDSHTEFSSYSNMRLDNYVYTEEALAQAKRLLKPDGILVLKFEVRPPWVWMGQRFFAMLEHIFKRPPIAYFCPRVGNMLSATVFIESTEGKLWDRAAQPELATFLRSRKNLFPVTSAGAPPAATDDWPYVYHRAHTVPRTYLSVSVILLLLSGLLARHVFDPKQASSWHFFLLGGGFLLLEAQMITRLALYFGTTWMVNSVALTGVLIVLVMANVFVERWQPRRLGAYLLSLVSCLAGVYLIQWDRIPLGSRGVGVLLGLAYAVALFFAGVIFSESFRRCTQKSSALGANIIGAVAGGLAQNLSFVFGIRFLLLLAMAFYAASRFFSGALNATSRAMAAQLNSQ